MASDTIRLTLSTTPAFGALVLCAQAIAEDEGEDYAAAWAKRVMEADIDLFVKAEAEKRPALRIIEGGRT